MIVNEWKARTFAEQEETIQAFVIEKVFLPIFLYQFNAVLFSFQKSFWNIQSQRLNKS